jgi:hypothetical protein
MPGAYTAGRHRGLATAPSRRREAGIVDDGIEIVEHRVQVDLPPHRAVTGRCRDRPHIMRVT